MSSHNKGNCGRRKAFADPRRKVKCPVSEWEFTGRIDNTRVHLRHLIFMKTFVETQASHELSCLYRMNKHSALGDAETLCWLSHSRSLVQDSAAG